MKRIAFLVTSFLVISSFGFAQRNEKAFFGFGMGLDYGGIGCRIEFQPVGAIGIFGGFGYNLIGPGFNAGVCIKPAPTKRFSPVFVAMYGYNAVLKYKYSNGTSEGTAYYGVTAGAGFQLYNKAMRNKLLVEILGPFRSSKYKNAIAGRSFDRKPGDVLFSVGYNFGVGKKKR